MVTFVMSIDGASLHVLVVLGSADTVIPVDTSDDVHVFYEDSWFRRVGGAISEIPQDPDDQESSNHAQPPPPTSTPPNLLILLNLACF